MSRAEHDAAAALHVDRSWCRRAAGVLERRGLRGLRCLDPCAGNAEFFEIPSVRFFNRRVLYERLLLKDLADSCRDAAGETAR